MNLQTLYKLLPVFVAVGMVLGLGVFIMATIAGNTGQLVTVDAENLTWVGTNETINVANKNITAGSFSIVNESNIVVDASNYTLNLVSGVLTVRDNRTGGANTSHDVVATYTYSDTSSTGRHVMNFVNEGMQPIGNTWFGILVLVLLAAIVVSLVTNMTRGRP